MYEWLSLTFKHKATHNNNSSSLQYTHTASYEVDVALRWQIKFQSLGAAETHQQRHKLTKPSDLAAIKCFELQRKFAFGIIAW